VTDDVLARGLAKKVTIHLNEDTSSRHDFLSREILALLLEENVAGATVVRPVSGFGSHRRVHTLEGGVDGDHHMPLLIEFVESEEHVEALLPRLMDLVTDGLIEAHDTMVLKTAVDGGEADGAARTLR
jgi:PII-like signaling protein